MLAAAPGATGVGIEGDPAAADLASATLHAHGVAPRAHVITSDARSVIGGGAAAIGGPVDLALLANVIYYIAPKERTAFLSRIAGLLNPRGALLIIITVASPGLTSRHFDLLLRAQDPRLELPSVPELIQQLRQSGLAPAKPERIVPGESVLAVLAEAQSR
jgi:cyclopropane fatty-acyl-phospholipid synthase-like methyltransferase